MLPAGMFIATFLAPRMAPHYDSGDMSSAGWICLLGPLGVAFGTMGFQESLRPGGSKSLGKAVISCALIVAGVLAGFWIIFHCDRLKR